MFYIFLTKRMLHKPGANLRTTKKDAPGGCFPHSRLGAPQLVLKAVCVGYPLILGSPRVVLWFVRCHDKGQSLYACMHASLQMHACMHICCLHVCMRTHTHAFMQAIACALSMLVICKFEPCHICIKDAQQILNA